MLGCEACAEVIELELFGEDPDLDELGWRECGSCEGRMLTVQESFDKILQLKRQLEDLGYEEETIS